MTRPFMRRLCSLAAPALLLLALAAVPAAEAQTRPRLGIGLDLHANTQEGFGPGLRARLSVPVNADISVAFGMAFLGYVLEGRDEATYAVDPQASLIVSLPARGNRLTYVLGGVGAYVPFDDGVESGPTLHLGLGRAHLLRDVSLYYEFNPTLLIGEEQLHFNFPLRLGLIF